MHTLKNTAESTLFVVMVEFVDTILLSVTYGGK